MTDPRITLAERLEARAAVLHTLSERTLQGRDAAKSSYAALVLRDEAAILRAEAAATPTPPEPRVEELRRELGAERAAHTETRRLIVTRYADAERVCEWMDTAPRKPAVLAFTAGNERQLAYRFEDVCARLAALESERDQLRAERDERSRLAVPNPCSVCGLPITIGDGSLRGTGDGTMRDGGSFAHDACYWRQENADLRASLQRAVEERDTAKRDERLRCAEELRKYKLGHHGGGTYDLAWLADRWVEQANTVYALTSNPPTHSGEGEKP